MFSGGVVFHFFKKFKNLLFSFSRGLEWLPLVSPKGPSGETRRRRSQRKMRTCERGNKFAQITTFVYLKDRDCHSAGGSFLFKLLFVRPAMACPRNGLILFETGIAQSKAKWKQRKS